ncbi:MAG: ABC transporter permease [Actinomycetaceae bacterium]|nr:ABC transporter permease [Actinomycetaceae bacterium]
MTFQSLQMKFLNTMGARSSFLRLALVTLSIFLLFSVLNPGVFLSGANFQFIFLSTPELALLALAISVTMLTAGIDLSVVGISNVSAIAAAQLMVIMGGTNQSVPVAMLVAVAVGAVCGLVNAALIALLDVPPILATLGTQQLFSGIALVLSGGSIIKGMPEAFTNIALITVAGIPLIFIIMLAIAALVGILVSKSSLGFQMRMVGSNPKASDYSGINRIKVLTFTYLTSGVLAGIAGLIISSRASGANSQYGVTYILLAIVVAVLAGVDPEGGYVTVSGVIIAVLALQMLSTGLLSIQNSPHVVNIMQGALLIFIVALNAWGYKLSAWIKALLGGVKAHSS